MEQDEIQSEIGFPLWNSL